MPPQGALMTETMAPVSALPFCLPKCHLNEIGPGSSGNWHCIITYLKTLIEHFIKRRALRFFCHGGHNSERDVFVCACMPACMCPAHVCEGDGMKMCVCVLEGG